MSPKNFHKPNRVWKIFTDLVSNENISFLFLPDHGHSSFAILSGVEVKVSEKFRPPEPVSIGTSLNLTELINFSPRNHQETSWFSDDFKGNRS